MLRGKPFLCGRFSFRSKAPSPVFLCLRSADREAWGSAGIIGVQVKMQVLGEYKPTCSEPKLLRLKEIQNFITFSH